MPSRPGEIYVGAESLYDRFIQVHGSRLASRYVHYEDGTFALQFSSPTGGFFEYPGRYTRTGSRITLAFGASDDYWPREGVWEAIGTLRGDSLSVEYNSLMGSAKFVDGVYVRSPGAP